jgi:hypothetical protein
MKGPGGLRIIRLGDTEAIPMVTMTERLWLTADGSRVVPDGDPAAAVLFATPGDEISEERAAELGIGAAPVRVKVSAKAGRKQRESVEEAAEDAEKE